MFVWASILSLPASFLALWGVVNLDTKGKTSLWLLPS